MADRLAQMRRLAGGTSYDYAGSVQKDWENRDAVEKVRRLLLLLQAASAAERRRATAATAATVAAEHRRDAPSPLFAPTQPLPTRR